MAAFTNEQGPIVYEKGDKSGLSANEQVQLFERENQQFQQELDAAKRRFDTGFEKSRAGEKNLSDAMQQAHEIAELRRLNEYASAKIGEMRLDHLVVSAKELSQNAMSLRELIKDMPSPTQEQIEAALEKATKIKARLVEKIADIKANEQELQDMLASYDRLGSDSLQRDSVQSELERLQRLCDGLEEHRTYLDSDSFLDDIRELSNRQEPAPSAPDEPKPELVLNENSAQPLQRKLNMIEAKSSEMTLAINSAMETLRKGPKMSLNALKSDVARARAALEKAKSVRATINRDVSRVADRTVVDKMDARLGDMQRRVNRLEQRYQVIQERQSQKAEQGAAARALNAAKNPASRMKRPRPDKTCNPKAWQQRRAQKREAQKADANTQNNVKPK